MTASGEAGWHAAIDALLAAERLDPSYRAFVLQHADAPDANWRWCCGSHCDPCVERLGRVVDGARRLRPAAPDSREGLPKPAGTA